MSLASFRVDITLELASHNLVFFEYFLVVIKDWYVSGCCWKKVVVMLAKRF